MKSIIFFLPFVLIASLGLYQDANAETITGYNYFDVTNPDGSHTFRSHHPYVLDSNQNYVPFVNSGLETTSILGKVTLNNGTYSWNGKFTDKIVAKYADVSDLNTWTYLNSLNNDTPDMSWNNNEFSNIKQNGVGILNYKYVFDNGKWKTQLEATNLSALTTKAFGFDQIVDLNSDMIKFGGVTRNLDNFDGQTFDKEFLDANQGKVLDLLNGINFDFDLGYENLYSITVYDTGVNKSRLVFDYRTSTPLLPNETLIIDPTYTDTATTTGRVFSSAATGTSCPAYSGGDGLHTLYRYPSDSNNPCNMNYYDYDISIIPLDATIASAYFEYDAVDANSVGTSAEDGILVNLASQAVGANIAIYNAGIAQTSKLTDNNEVILNSGGTNVHADFNSNGITELQNNLSDGWFSFVVTPTSWTRGAGVGNGLGVITFSNEELVIVYIIAEPPDAVTDLTSTAIGSSTVDLDWTAPSAGGGNQFIIGYQINVTSPQTSNPLVFVNDTGTTDTDYQVTGLLFGTDYSARVSAWGNVTGGHPLNNATGNVYNFTTTTTTYATAPVLVASAESTTQIDLDWTATTMDNVNGYKIQRETPIGTGWTTIVSNTTNTNLYYNNTGLTTNIIYNYRVQALNGSGVSNLSNEYAMTTFHLPDAVTDLTGVTNTEDSTITLSWTEPESYAPEIVGYAINYTVPVGDPLTPRSDSPVLTDDTEYIVLNLALGVEYSFRVAPLTVHGTNASGNIWNGSTSTIFVIGDLESPDVTNTDDFTIFFERTDLNSTAIQLDVIYSDTYNLNCDFSYKLARTNQTYSNLATTVVSADEVESSFVLINATGDIIEVTCWDVASGVESDYVIVINDFPLLEQIQNLRNGTYGTYFQIGAIDGITLVGLFLAMIGFNRTTPVVGIVFMAIAIFTLSWFEIITYPIIMYPALALLVVWGFISTRKDD